MENRFKKARTIHNRHGAQSTKEVAKETGVTKSLIEDIESTVGTPRNVGYLTVKKLAQYYGVSSDYLLGLTDTPSVKEDIQVVCKTTGLSEDAIGYLKRATNEHYEDRRMVLSALLENYDFYHLLGIIYECSEAISPREEIFKIPVDDRFPNHSSKEIFEALAVNWTAKVISSTVELLKGEGESNGQHQTE